MSEIMVRERFLRSGKKVYEYSFEMASVDGKRKRKSKSGFASKRDARIAGRKALSESRKGHWYTDGINNRFIKDGDIIPEGYVRGMRYTSNKGGDLPLCQ